MKTQSQHMKGEWKFGQEPTLVPDDTEPQPQRSDIKPSVPLQHWEHWRQQPRATDDKPWIGTDGEYYRNDEVEHVDIDTPAAGGQYLGWYVKGTGGKVAVNRSHLSATDDKHHCVPCLPDTDQDEWEFDKYEWTCSCGKKWIFNRSVGAHWTQATDDKQWKEQIRETAIDIVNKTSCRSGDLGSVILLISELVSEICDANNAALAKAHQDGWL